MCRSSRMSDLTALKSPLITLGPLIVSEICGGRCSPRGAAPRHPQCTLASRSFFDGLFSSAARRDCRRTACNFALNKGLTQLRTAGRFVPFRWHFIVSILFCPSQSWICSVRNHIEVSETCQAYWDYWVILYL